MATSMPSCRSDLPIGKNMLKKLIIIALCWNTPLSAKTFALLIGIDKYEYMSDLHGAVNDANDIEDALINIGVSSNDIIKLTNKKATKKAIKNGWQELIRKSAKGDTLLLSYAGHGTQEEDLNGDEKRYDPDDTLDETRLLGGFSALDSKAHEQRIVDDELYQWFQQAQGRRIIYIVDSCHSGQSYRGVDPRATPMVSRFQNLSKTRLTVPVDTLAVSSNAPEAELENFIFFSASDDNKKAYEYPIEGRIRGALSWAFSRAIQYADRDRNGLTLAELSLYVRDKVKQQSNNSQFPNVAPRGNSEMLVFSQGYKAQPRPIVESNHQTKLALAIKGTPLKGKLHRVHVVPSKQADIIWDVAKKEVIIAGDMTAYGIGTVQAMQKVIDKWFLVQKMMQLSEFHPMESQLGNSNQHAKVHRFGDKIHFSLSAKAQHTELLQFNLAGNGEIECYPIDKAGTKSYQFVAKSPAGNDSLISIAIGQPPKALVALVDSCPNAVEFEAELPKLLKGLDYQMSRVDVFTHE